MASHLPDNRPPGPVAARMATRIRNLLLRPREEWARIDAEPMTVRDMMIGWAAPLAAIGPLAVLIGTQAFGFRFLGIVYRPPLGNSIATAVVGWLTYVIGIYAVAWIIDNIAPQFGTKRDMIAATKLAVFSFIPIWLVAIVDLVPGLSVLKLAGFYSFYLLWLGLPMLMKPPADKAQTYAAVAIACGIIAYAVVQLVVSQVAAAFTPAVNGIGSISIT